MAIACIENLVGLIHPDKDCACFNASKPANFDALNASLSGRYLIDDSSDLGAPLLEQILNTADCQDSDNVWTALVNARKAALNLLEPELQAELAVQYERGVTEIIEELAERDATSTRSINRAYGGQQVIVPRWKDWKLNVTKIWTGFDTSHNFDLTVHSNNPDFAEQVFSLSATANTWTENDLPNTVVMPFWGKARVNDRWADNRYLYNFRYSNPTPIRAMDNKIHCGCSGSIPRFWKYFQVHGYEDDTLQVRYSSNLTGNGLVLDGFLSCDNLQWICELTESGGKDMQDVLALAVMYKGIAMLAKDIISTGRINYWSVLDNVQSEKTYYRAKAEYNKLRTWIAHYLPKGATNCYECRPSMQMAMA